MGFNNKQIDLQIDSTQIHTVCYLFSVFGHETQIRLHLVAAPIGRQNDGLRFGGTLSACGFGDCLAFFEVKSWINQPYSSLLAKKKL